MNNLLEQIKINEIDFVIANGENAAEAGVGITKEICKDFFKCGVDVITTGNHVWDQKEIMNFIDKENRLLRPKNLFEPAPGKGFEVYTTEKNMKIAVLNLMGNVFMKKCDDVFETSKKFIDNYKLKQDYDFLVVDFHGEITSEKNAIGHLFDGKATLVVGTHTHIPTNDTRVLKNGTAYQTDAGMCGDYDSVIGTKKQEFVRKFATQDTERKRVPPADGIGTLCGVIIESQDNNFLAKNIQSIRIGGKIGS
jgi:metallophosphoesterase (TIGR00282 family)